MKRNLFLAAVFAGLCANATVTDITPKGYLFNNVNSFSYFSQGCGGANIGTPAWNTIEGSKNWNDGLVVVCGNPNNFGPNKGGALTFSVDDNKGGFTALIAGTSLVDMGGEVGKVLCLNGMNSNFDAKIKELYGVELNTPKLTKNPGWFNINFFTHADDTPSVGVDETYLNIRCRITLNCYNNNITDGVTMADPYMAVNMGGHNQVEATDRINTDAFIKYVDDDPTGDPEEGDDGNLVWNPNTWMVYEKNISIAAADNNGQYGPARLKFGIKPDVLTSGAILIKSIEFFAVTKDEAAASTDAIINMIKLTPNFATSGISDINTDNNIDFAINGNAVTFNADADIYTISGVKVASVKAGESVELKAGFYVANAAGKGVKFSIK